MILRSLGRDPVVLATLGLAVLLALPVAVPSILPIERYTYLETCTTIPFLVLAIATYARRMRGAAREERRFWGLLIAALACWIGQQLLLIATWSMRDVQWGWTLQDALYSGLYLFVVLALDVQPHRERDLDDRGLLAAIRRAGTVVFVFGLLLYLVLVPASMTPSTYWGSFPSFALYIVLDSYLLIRLAAVAFRASSAKWRSVYGALFATVLFWLILDSVETLLVANAAAETESGSPWDPAWMLSAMMLVVVGRASATAATSGATPAETGQRDAPARMSAGGPLILAAMVVPLLHFAVYRIGIFDAATHRAHESLAFALIVVLGSLVFAYQRLLERQARRLEAERSAALAQVEHQAFHDPLTGLPNRRLLGDRLAHAVALAARRSERLVVLFFDLDDFKRVNDSHGHAFGDALLERIGQRLASQVRASDTLARIGGDEFVVVASGVDSRASAARLAEKIVASLAEPIEQGGETFSVRASVGVALYPDDGTDERELLRRADAAMYEVKLARRSETSPR